MEQFIWPGTVLIIFLGMLIVVLYALRIAHDLAKIVLQTGAPLPKFPPIQPTPEPAPAPVAPRPVVVPLPRPVTLPPVSTQPVDIVDQAFMDFVKEQEGFEPKAKWDYKQYTNGYGTKALSPTETIDQATAETRLRSELASAVAAMKQFIPNAPIGVQQGMVDAVFNLGTEWEHQTLGTLLAQGNYAEAKTHLMQYVHAGNPPVVLDALVKRRTAECKMFDVPL
jgi:GH24 family phage-related lysozyme (muramidase)